MATAGKRDFSASTDGRGILVVATTTLGTTIHQPVAGTTVGTWDEVWLYAYNSHTAAVVLSIEFGGVTDPKDVIALTVPSKSGLVLVIPGFPLQNSTNAVVTAFASVASKVSVFGYVNAITD